jgi:hypothetical protein
MPRKKKMMRAMSNRDSNGMAQTAKAAPPAKA